MNLVACVRGNLVAACVVFIGAFAVDTAESAEPLRVILEQEADGPTVYVGDKSDGLFVRYCTRSGAKPVLWPVCGPTGDRVTRDYPVGPPGPHEETDHIHHRSMWFAYEGLNGVDFWHEPEMNVQRHFPIGSIVHREFVRNDCDGRRATIATRNDYVDQSGKVVAKDERMYVFSATDQTRTIDAKVTLWSTEGPLKLIDTKEGAFAVRVAGSMKVDARMGGKIVASNGKTDADAWGQPAEWVDYSGKVNDQAVGIAILSHPSNVNPKPCWHVRPYGLFAANPFGSRPYGQDAEGGFESPEGKPVTLRFRVLLHKGDHQQAGVAEAFRNYAG